MNKATKSNHRKYFLRDVELPLATSNAQVLKPSAAAAGANKIVPANKPVVKNVKPAVTKLAPPAATNKFKQPELHSALNLRKQIEKVKTLQSKGPSCIGELTPKSKRFVRDQITRKLNFQHDENVFKGLVPVNVNDSVLIPTIRKPLRTKFISKEKRDPEPELADFLRPIPKCNILFDPYLPREPEVQRPNFNNFDNIMDVFARIDIGA